MKATGVIVLYILQKYLKIRIFKINITNQNVKFLHYTTLVISTSEVCSDHGAVILRVNTCTKLRWSLVAFRGRRTDRQDTTSLSFHILQVKGPDIGFCATSASFKFRSEALCLHISTSFACSGLCALFRLTCRTFKRIPFPNCIPL
jgi:hypothetical protein